MVEGNVALSTRTCICLHPRNKKEHNFLYAVVRISSVVDYWTVQIQIRMHSARHDSSSSLASFLEILPNIVKSFDVLLGLLPWRRGSHGRSPQENRKT